MSTNKLNALKVLPLLALFVLSSCSSLEPGVKDGDKKMVTIDDQEIASDVASIQDLADELFNSFGKTATTNWIARVILSKEGVISYDENGVASGARLADLIKRRNITLKSSWFDATSYYFNDVFYEKKLVDSLRSTGQIVTCNESTPYYVGNPKNLRIKEGSIYHKDDVYYTGKNPNDDTDYKYPITDLLTCNYDKVYMNTIDGTILKDFLKEQYVVDKLLTGENSVTNTKLARKIEEFSISFDANNTNQIDLRDAINNIILGIVTGELYSANDRNIPDFIIRYGSNDNITYPYAEGSTTLAGNNFHNFIDDDAEKTIAKFLLNTKGQTYEEEVVANEKGETAGASCTDNPEVNCIELTEAKEAYEKYFTNANIYEFRTYDEILKYSKLNKIDQDYYKYFNYQTTNSTSKWYMSTSAKTTLRNQYTANNTISWSEGMENAKEEIIRTTSVTETLASTDSKPYSDPVNSVLFSRTRAEDFPNFITSKEENDIDYRYLMSVSSNSAADPKNPRYIYQNEVTRYVFIRILDDLADPTAENTKYVYAEAVAPHVSRLDIRAYSHYFKKYNIQFGDQELFDYLKTTYPDYFEEDYKD